MRHKQFLPIKRKIVKSEAATLVVLSVLLSLSGIGLAQDRPAQRPTLTPKLALQLIADKLREPYAGNSIYFDSGGRLLSNLSDEFASFMIKQEVMTCSKVPTGQVGTAHCQLTEKGRKSPSFGTKEFRGRVNCYLRWSDAKNPQLVATKIADTSSVPFRFTVEPNSFGAQFFGNETRDVEAKAQFAFKSGHWNLVGIKGMPGD